MNLQSRSVVQDDEGTFTIDLGKGAPLTPSAVYRALVKLVISVVPMELLPHLEKTIEWVRHGVGGVGALPKVATAVVHLPPDPSAQITVYVRKQLSSRLPHLIGEFRLGCYLYVFAVPFSDLDQWDLVGFFDEPDFRATFRHFVESPAQWVHQDLSRQTKVQVSPRLKLVRNTP